MLMLIRTEGITTLPNPAPYAPLRTQKEVDEKDERLRKILLGIK